MSMRDRFLKIKNKKLFEQLREFMIMGQFKEAQEAIDSIDVQYLDSPETSQFRIDAWNAMCITRKGKYQEALDTAEEIIGRCQQDRRLTEARLDAIIVRAFAFSALGKIEEGLKMCGEAEGILKALDLTTRENRARLAKVLTIQGLNALHQGDLDLAIEIYSQSYPILEELGNLKSAAAALHNIGSAYRVIGDLDQALEFVSHSRLVSEDIGYTPNLAGAITTTGIILFQKGRLEEAANNLDQAISMFEDIGHKVYLARCLYYAVIIALAQNNLEKVKGFIDQMRAISDEVESLLISQHYRVARALWLKAKSTVESLREAKALFEEVVDEKITFFEVTFLSLLSLSDLLLDEMRTTGNEEITTTIKDYAEMALEIATSQGSHWLEAETYCLQAQIALLEFEYEKAKRLLTRAQLISDEKGLHQLARRISSEFDDLLSKEEEWTKLTKTGAPVAERVKAAQIDERVERMSKIQEAIAPKDSKDNPIQFMLISAYGGGCIVSKEFETSFKVDESLVSGFMSAMRSFSDEVFSMPLDRIKVGDYIMLFRAIIPFLFCYVFKGESYTALKKVEQIIEMLQSDEETWSSLKSSIDSGIMDIQVNQKVEQIVMQVFEMTV